MHVAINYRLGYVIDLASKEEGFKLLGELYNQKLDPNGMLASIQHLLEGFLIPVVEDGQEFIYKDLWINSLIPYIGKRIKTIEPKEGYRNHKSVGNFCFQEKNIFRGIFETFLLVTTHTKHSGHDYPIELEYLKSVTFIVEGDHKIEIPEGMFNECNCDPPSS